MCGAVIEIARGSSFVHRPWRQEGVIECDAVPERCMFASVSGVMGAGSDHGGRHLNWIRAAGQTGTK